MFLGTDAESMDILKQFWTIIYKSFNKHNQNKQQHRHKTNKQNGLLRYSLVTTLKEEKSLE